METYETVKILKALGEETRIEIFETLRGGRLCACKILDKLKVTQPTLSHHMKILCDSGLIIAEKDWKHTYYSINCEKLKEFLSFFLETKCNTKCAAKREKAY